jgi:hypothetical protein
VAYLIEENCECSSSRTGPDSAIDVALFLPFECINWRQTAAKPTQGEGNNRPILVRQNARSSNLTQRDAKGS